MVFIGSLRVILERLVVRNIVTHGRREIVSGKPGVMRTADCPAVGIYARRRESALKPAPGNALGVQQIADILTSYRDHGRRLQFGVGHHAIVEARAPITYDRAGREPSEDVPVCARGSAIGS